LFVLGFDEEVNCVDENVVVDDDDGEDECDYVRAISDICGGIRVYDGGGNEANDDEKFDFMVRYLCNDL
jgi:hypothetical protein